MKQSSRNNSLLARFGNELRRNYRLYALAIPGLILILTFSYIPMLGHVLAFKKYTFTGGLFGSPGVGFKNFEFFFGSRDWKTVTFNTLFLNAIFIVSNHLTAIMLAIFLNEIKKSSVKRVFQSLIFLPYFVSWLVVSLMIFGILNATTGTINGLFDALGLERVNYYLKPGAWRVILPIAYVWKFAGYYSIIYLAAIIGIPNDYYESAAIDGASRWQQVRKITLPLIRPTVIVLVLIALGRIFYGDFGMIYGIIGDIGILYPTTDVIDTYSFRTFRQLGNFGMTSAVSLYQAVMGLITILIFNTIVRRVDPDSSLF